MTFRPAKCDHQILSLDKSSFAQSLVKCSDDTTGVAAAAEEPNYRHRWLLRARRKRPHRRCAAEKANELTSPHIRAQAQGPALYRPKRAPKGRLTCACC